MPMCSALARRCLAAYEATNQVRPADSKCRWIQLCLWSQRPKAARAVSCVLGRGLLSCIHQSSVVELRWADDAVMHLLIHGKASHLHQRPCITYLTRTLYSRLCIGKPNIPFGLLYPWVLAGWATSRFHSATRALAGSMADYSIHPVVCWCYCTWPGCSIAPPPPLFWSFGTEDMMAFSARTCALKWILPATYDLWVEGAEPFVRLLVSTGFMDKYAMPPRKAQDPETGSICLCRLIRV
jgi:hypothetical protein